MYLLLVAMLLSPFYFWRSGLPQVSHLVAAAAVGNRIVFKPKIICFEKEWYPLLLFLLYASLVALTVYIGYADINTLLAPLYYIFGFLIFLEIVNVFIEKGEVFLVRVLWLHLIILAVVTVVSFMGIGRSIFHEGIRLMFAFNNPNQLANWTIWIVVIVSACGRAVYRSWLPGLIAFILSTVLVGYSVSRAGFVGVSVLSAFYGALGVYHLVSVSTKQWQEKNKRHFWFIVIIVIVMCAALMISATAYYISSESISIDLLDTMINRVVNTDINRQLELRGYDRLWQYPEYLLFGAGEGARNRFAEKTSFTQYEIHSSWAGLLFNYGLVGFVLFAKFLVAILKRIDLIWFKLLLLAPFFFSFSNYNIRNWYFWVGLALVYCCALMVKTKEGREQEYEMVDVGKIGLNMRMKIVKRLSRF